MIPKALCTARKYTHLEHRDLANTNIRSIPVNCFGTQGCRIVSTVLLPWSERINRTSSHWRSHQSKTGTLLCLPRGNLQFRDTTPSSMRITPRGRWLLRWYLIVRLSPRWHTEEGSLGRFFRPCGDERHACLVDLDKYAFLLWNIAKVSFCKCFFKSSPLKD